MTATAFLYFSERRFRWRALPLSAMTRTDTGPTGRDSPASQHVNADAASTAHLHPRPEGI
jgi:hypothetical protein